MGDKIKCSDCVFAKVDKNASVYSNKYCKKCDSWETCEICCGCENHNSCKARQNINYKQGCERRLETVCSKQTLKWAAIQCTNCDSQYHRSLLNITVQGNMQKDVTWCGCAEGRAKA